MLVMTTARFKLLASNGTVFFLSPYPAQLFVRHWNVASCKKKEKNNIIIGDYLQMSGARSFVEIVAILEAVRDLSSGEATRPCLASRGERDCTAAVTSVWSTVSSRFLLCGVAPRGSFGL